MLLPIISSIATKNVVTVDQDSSIEDAIALMRQRNIRDMIVKLPNEYRIVTALDIIRFELDGTDFSAPLSSVSIPKVPHVSLNADIFEILDAIDEQIEHICVVNDDGTLYGIVSYSDLVGSVDTEAFSESRSMADMMERKCFLRVQKGISAHDVFELMKNGHHHEAIIYDKEEAIGIITQKDIINFAYEKNDLARCAESFMSSPLKTIPVCTPPLQALEFSKQNKIKRILVSGETNGQIIGFISQKDLVHFAYDKYSKIIKGNEKRLNELVKYKTAILEAEIQEHIRTQRQLQNERLLLQTIIDSIPDFIFYKDKESTYIGCNKAFEAYCGLDRSQIVGKSDFDFTTPEMARFYRQKDQEMLHSGTSKRNTEYIEYKNGGKDLFETLKTPLLDPDKNVIGLLGISRNITEQKTAQDSLQRSQKQLSDAQKLAHIGSWQLDIQTGKLEWSDEIYNIFEIDKDGFAPSYEEFLKLVHPEDKDKLNEAYMRSVAEKTPYELTHRLLLSDGSIKYVREKCETIYDENGKPTRSLGTTQDVTQYTLVEIALKKSETNLQERVEQETQSRLKAEKLLIQQSKMAAMGEMLGAIAHQWRQPLNALALYIQDIKSAYSYDELNEEYIDDMIDSSMKQINHMSKTIDDFRKFLLIDKKRELFDVYTLTKEAAELTDAQLKSHNITCSVSNPSAEEITINGYPNEFKQVILNIINNAKDAINERRMKNEGFKNSDGVIDIKISKNAAGLIEIVACDNGGGISSELLDRIFEPYFTTKEQGKGVGIGLYMSKMIVEENMTGSITAENTKDGACFTIMLPSGM